MGRSVNNYSVVCATQFYFFVHIPHNYSSMFFFYCNHPNKDCFLVNMSRFWCEEHGCHFCWVWVFSSSAMDVALPPTSVLAIVSSSVFTGSIAPLFCFIVTFVSSLVSAEKHHSTLGLHRWLRSPLWLCLCQGLCSSLCSRSHHRSPLCVAECLASPICHKFCFFSPWGFPKAIALSCGSVPDCLTHLP